MKKLILFFLACSLMASPAMAAISMPKPSKAAFEQFSKKIAEIAHKPVKAVSHDAKALWIWGLKKLKFNKEPLSKQEIDDARRASKHLFYTGLTIATIALVLGFISSSLYMRHYNSSEERDKRKKQRWLKAKDPAALINALIFDNIEQAVEALGKGIDANATDELRSGGTSALEYADELRNGMTMTDKDSDYMIKKLIKHGATPYKPTLSVKDAASANGITEDLIKQELDNHPELQRFAIKDQLGNYTHVAPYLFMSTKGQRAADEAVKEYIN